MDDLFRRTFGQFGQVAETKGVMSPTINTYSKGNTFCVEAEIPGVEKGDLDVSVDGDILTLRGERKESREVKEEEYIVRESQFGSFVRRLTLPEGVNADQIHASYDNGILKISMPVEKKLSTGRKVRIEGPEEGKKVHH
jgi:HSP20 family protein